MFSQSSWQRHRPRSQSPREVSHPAVCCGGRRLHAVAMCLRGTEIERARGRAAPLWLAASNWPTAAAGAESARLQLPVVAHLVEGVLDGYDRVVVTPRCVHPAPGDNRAVQKPPPTAGVRRCLRGARQQGAVGCRHPSRASPETFISGFLSAPSVLKSRSYILSAQQRQPSQLAAAVAPLLPGSTAPPPAPPPTPQARGAAGALRPEWPHPRSRIRGD